MKFGSQIYFCGYKIINEIPTAIAGYFDMTTFPSTQVIYYPFPALKKFEKMDLYTISSPTYEKHLVMTGTRQDGFSTIVDAIVSSSNWSYQRPYFGGASPIYDDVAVTDHYIVFSARDFVDFTPVVRILYYNRPTTSGSTIFLSNVVINNITNPVSDVPVILGHLYDDEVGVSFCKSGTAIPVLAWYSGTSLSAVLRFDADVHRPLQIDYHMKKKAMEVLFKMKPDNMLTQSYLLQIPLATFLNPFHSTVFAHHFGQNRLWSMHVSPFDSGRVASAGCNMYDNILTVFKHMYGEWNQCPLKLDIIAWHYGFSGSTYQDFPPIVFPLSEVSPIVMPIAKDSVEKVRVCNY